MSEAVAMLPSQQHEWSGLPRLDERALYIRRETVFLVLSGLFLGTLAMLNILGITRFIKLWDTGTELAGVPLVFAVAVGVLPYPLTFLCTDFISELYGRKRASRVVWMGLGLNIWVMGILWVGGALPGFESDHPVADRAGAVVIAESQQQFSAEQISTLQSALDATAQGREQETRAAAPGVGAAAMSGEAHAEFLASLDGFSNDERDLIAQRLAQASGTLIAEAAQRDPVYYEVRTLAFGAVVASMLAYLIAQLVDVHVFHFWKRLTGGKHLWIRNNGSTLVSQLVDTTAVVLITHFYARALPIRDGAPVGGQLMVFIAAGYAFKVLAALIDTLPFYYGSRALRRYLRLPPASAHA